MSYRFVSFYWYACVLRCVSLQLAISLALSLFLLALKLCLQLAQTVSLFLSLFSLLFLSAFASCFARHRLLLLLFCSPCCCLWINKCHMWLCGLPACPFPVASIYCIFVRLAVMATILVALRSTARPTPPPCVSFTASPAFSTCSIFYTFKSSVLWRFCSRFKK